VGRSPASLANGREVRAMWGLGQGIECRAAKVASLAGEVGVCLEVGLRLMVGRAAIVSAQLGVVRGSARST
jgi:hypothetical protein